MGRKDIRKFSPAYQLLLLFAEIYKRFFYKRFSAKGKDHIPKNTAVLFVGVHQNALMDPLAVIFALHRQVVFFARADIFRKKTIARMLYFLRILPIYRPRDGFRSVEQNQEVFEEGIAVLQHKQPVGILPEGNHVGEKRLRPLRKGAARLALFAEEASAWNLGLHIVPVGFDYSDYFHAGSDLLVVFGEAFPVEPYRALFEENQPQAIAQLKEDIAAAMRKVMIDIRPEEYYQAIHLASELYTPLVLKDHRLRNSLYNNFLVKKDITEKLNGRAEAKDDRMETLQELTKEYRHKLEMHNIRDWLVKDGAPGNFSFFLRSLLMVLLFPLHLYGMLLNWLPYGIPTKLSKKIKDPHLAVSVNFGAGFLLFLLWYAFILVVVCVIPCPYSYKTVFLLSLPFSGLFSFYYYKNFLKMKGRWRWMKLRKGNKREYEKVALIRKKIIETVAGLTN